MKCLWETNEQNVQTNSAQSKSVAFRERGKNIIKRETGAKADENYFSSLKGLILPIYC